MGNYINSLASAFDIVEDAHFFGKKIVASEREALAKSIASQQGLDGSYAGMFAPTPADFKNGIKLFTGEVIRSGASLRHVSGEEACRALLLLNSKSATVKNALKTATDGMREALDRGRQRGGNLFCCGTCDPSLWRHITAGGLRGEDEWLDKGTKALRMHQNGKGEWRRFPFFFTLLALLEQDSKPALAEMRYAAPRCERYLSVAPRSNVVAVRRRAVCERVLNRL